METISTTVTLRPLRIGFLVDPAQRTKLSSVMRMATCMWGGMMCPLIPVMSRLPKEWRNPPFKVHPKAVTDGLLRFFEPDVLVETTPGQLSALGLNTAGNFSDRKRFHKFSQLIRQEIGLGADLALGVNMSGVYHHLFKKEFQFKKRFEPRIFNFNDGDKIGNAFFEAAFGMFPKVAKLKYIPHNYTEALGAKAVDSNFDTWKELAQDRAGFPLYYTVRDLEIRYDNVRGPSVFIFDPLNSRDVIDFWNFRLFTRDVLPVNIHWLEQSRDIIFNHIRLNYRPLPTNPNGIMIDTTINVARSINYEQVMSVLNFADANLEQGSFSLKNWYDRIWTPPDDRVFSPSMASVSCKSKSTQLVTDPADSSSVQIQALHPEFDTHCRGLGPSWVNIVRTGFYGGSTAFADALPSAGFLVRNEYPTRAVQDQIPTREGFVTFHEYAHDTMYFKLPRRLEAITNWLANKQITATQSDAGRVADQVIESVGGLSPIALFKHLDFVKLLNKMAKSRKQWSETESEDFSDRTANVGEWQKALSQVHKKPFGRHITLDRFVQAGILRLGLAVSCSHCTKENWYSLDDIASTIRCDRCLKDFKYPQGVSQKPTVWKYRVIGPFATPNYAQGAYSVSLTLRFLQDNVHQGSEFTYATCLDLVHDGKKLETDLFAWHNFRNIGRSQNDPVTLIGECKSLGEDAIKAKEIDRLKALATLLPGAYVVVSTLKPNFSRDEIRLLKSLASWGWKQRKKVGLPVRLILLTETELCLEVSTKDTWAKLGGRMAELANEYSYIFNFDALTDATQRAYLGYSAAQLHQMKYAFRRRTPQNVQAQAGLVGNEV